MDIIKLDDLRKGGGANSVASVTIYKTGKVIFSRGVDELLKFPQHNFLHFYQEEEDIWIKSDNNAVHALRIGKDKKGSLQGYSKHLAEHLSIQSNNQRYRLDPDDFGKFKLVPYV